MLSTVMYQLDAETKQRMYLGEDIWCFCSRYTGMVMVIIGCGVLAKPHRTMRALIDRE